MSFFILHGLGADSQANWFPWLKGQLEGRGEDVVCPDFPRSLWPAFAAWADHLDQFANKIDRASTFVGHSLGCPFSVRYLADRGFNVRHFVLVAPVFTDLGWEQLKDMLSGFPPENARDVADRFTIVASDDDPYIPVSDIRAYEDLLGVRATILPDREHLWQRELPEVLDCLDV